MSSATRIVIAIDGLRASSLGAYGNAIVTTSAFDHLAATGTVVDNCFVASHDLTAVYETLWSAEHNPQLVISDDPDIIELAQRREIEVLAVNAGVTAPAALFSDTGIAKLLNEACSRLSQGMPVGTVWIHCHGLHAPWDAPSQIARSLADEEDDPEIPADVDVPLAVLTGEDDDGDAIFIATCRYQAQVAAIDACLEGFMNWIDDLDGPPLEVVVCGTRGFALGEHGQIGGSDRRHYSEQTHVPYIVRGNAPGPRRLSQLVWLGDMFGEARRGEGHEFLVWSMLAEVTAIRTPYWFARFAADEMQHELFVKPDDRWEANDVATRCRRELGELEKLAGMQRSQSDI